MKEVRNVSLREEGLNTVEVPEGEVLGVVVGPGYAPALAMLSERAAKTVSRTFFVTRQHIGEGVELGRHVGHAQDAGGAAMHVFEVDGDGEGEGASKQRKRR